MCQLIPRLLQFFRHLPWHLLPHLEDTPSGRTGPAPFCTTSLPPWLSSLQLLQPGGASFRSLHQSHSSFPAFTWPRVSSSGISPPYPFPLPGWLLPHPPDHKCHFQKKTSSFPIYIPPATCTSLQLMSPHLSILCFGFVFFSLRATTDLFIAISLVSEGRGGRGTLRNIPRMNVNTR